MIQRMVEEIKSKYACKTQDVGVFEKVVIDGATFRMCAYNMKGLGRVATVQMKRLVGFWDMQSLIITPFEKDMPIYYYNRHREKGKYIYRVEVFDTQFEPIETSTMEAVVEKYKELPDDPQNERWYDEYKLPVCAVKKVEKKRKEDLSPMIWEHFCAYMDLLEKAPECKPVEKKKKVNVFVNELCEKSGIAIIEIFIANYGTKITEKLANEVLFGLK
ncbi:MAG: hypothetical protein IJ455_04295 [Agathobacter sp.]|nr:hypothetical protein [Agathobacter sp.]